MENKCSVVLIKCNNKVVQVKGNKKVKEIDVIFPVQTTQPELLRVGNYQTDTSIYVKRRRAKTKQNIVRNASAVLEFQFNAITHFSYPS